MFCYVRLKSEIAGSSVKHAALDYDLAKATYPGAPYRVSRSHGNGRGQNQEYYRRTTTHTCYASQDRAWDYQPTSSKPLAPSVRHTVPQIAPMMLSCPRQLGQARTERVTMIAGQDSQEAIAAASLSRKRKYGRENSAKSTMKMGKSKTLCRLQSFVRY